MGSWRAQSTARFSKRIRHIPGGQVHQELLNRTWDVPSASPKQVVIDARGRMTGDGSLDRSHSYTVPPRCLLLATIGGECWARGTMGLTLHSTAHGVKSIGS